MSQVPEAIERFLTARAILVLLLLGGGLIAAGLTGLGGPTGRVKFSVLGVVVVIFAVLLPRLQGDVQLGPGGLKVQLREELAAALPEAVAEVNKELGESAPKLELDSSTWQRLIDRLAEQMVLSRCKRCGRELPQHWDEPVRKPCPWCGATTRAYGVRLEGRL